jgi:hypothetical protein
MSYKPIVYVSVGALAAAQILFDVAAPARADYVPPDRFHYKIISSADTAQLDQLSQQKWIIRGGVVCPPGIPGPSAGGGSPPTACVMLQQPF